MSDVLKVFYVIYKVSDCTGFDIYFKCVDNDTKTFISDVFEAMHFKTQKEAEDYIMSYAIEGVTVAKITLSREVL